MSAGDPAAVVQVYAESTQNQILFGVFCTVVLAYSLSCGLWYFFRRHLRPIRGRYPLCVIAFVWSLTGISLGYRIPEALSKHTTFPCFSVGFFQIVMHSIATVSFAARFLLLALDRALVNRRMKYALARVSFAAAVDVQEALKLNPLTKKLFRNQTTGKSHSETEGKSKATETTDTRLGSILHISFAF